MMAQIWKIFCKLGARHAVPLLLLTACGFKHATLIPPSHQTKQAIEDVYVVLVLIDGGRPQDVDALVAEGRLPNFKTMFYDQGARIQNAVTVIPTTSSPAHQSFVSGLFPGHHGIPNLDWFSRPLTKYIDYLRVRDISLTNTYLFNFNQVLEGEVRTDEPQLIYHALHGHPTMTVFETATSGATRVLPEGPPFLTAYHGKIQKFYEEFDLEAMKHALKSFRELPADKLPRFSYITFLGMDLVTHFDGPNGTRVQDLYLQYDRFLGELKATLAKRGIWEKTTMVVLSDHGQHALNKVTDLPSVIRHVGLHYDKANLKKSQVVYGDHGIAYSNLYLRIGEDWEIRPTYLDLKNYPIEKDRRIDLFAKFLEHPDIEFAIGPEGPWRVHVHRKEAHAVLERRKENGKWLYAYLPSQGDPLDYLRNSEIAAWTGQKKFLDAESWLRVTQNSDFPDAVVLLSHLFDDYRTGDMAILTVKNSQFKEKRFAGHGSIYAEDLKVLLMFHGPSIQPGIQPYARSVDLYPTLLSLFGIRSKAPMDGIARLELFKKPPIDLPPALEASEKFSVEDFRERLQDRLKSGGLNREEKEKAVQMLYSMDQLQSDRERYAQPKGETLQKGVAQKP